MKMKEEYKLGQEIKIGKKKYLIIKVNKNTIIAREFTRTTKGNMVNLKFGDRYEIKK